MNMSGTSMVAFGFAALLGVTGFAYSDVRNQLIKSEDTVANLQSNRDLLNKQNESLRSERDQLKKQTESLQQQISTSNRQTGDLERNLRQSQSDAEAYQGQVETLGVCLQGVAKGIIEINQGNRDGAIIAFSSVSNDCEKADKILEQQNSSGSPQEQPTTNVGSSL
jgi:septal ring factor EnvC (AmiA/AmiB activator)